MTITAFIFQKTWHLASKRIRLARTLVSTVAKQWMVTVTQALLLDLHAHAQGEQISLGGE